MVLSTAPRCRPGTPHAVERYLALADHALATRNRRHDSEPGLAVAFPAAARRTASRAGDMAKLQDDFILLHPFSRGEGKSLTMRR